MKKIIIIVVALVFALFLANTALAQFVDASDVSATANSSSIDVQIVQRTQRSDIETVAYQELVDPVSMVEEMIENLAPGNEIVLSYKIVNSGAVDVVVTGVNVEIDKEELKKSIILKWTITKYVDSQAVESITNSANGETLDEISLSTYISNSNIELECNSSTDDYCTLELVIQLDDSDQILNDAVQETVFRVTPVFTQN